MKQRGNVSLISTSRTIQSTPDRMTSVKGTISLIRKIVIFCANFHTKWNFSPDIRTSPKKMSRYPWMFLYKFREVSKHNATDQNFCKYYCYSWLWINKNENTEWEIIFIILVHVYSREFCDVKINKKCLDKEAVLGFRTMYL